MGNRLQYVCIFNVRWGMHRQFRSPTFYRSSTFKLSYLTVILLTFECDVYHVKATPTGKNATS